MYRYSDPETTNLIYSYCKEIATGHLKTKQTSRQEDAESSLASLSPFTSMPTSPTVTPRGKQVVTSGKALELVAAVT